MNYLFVTSKEDLDLAQAEIEVLIDTKTKRTENVVFGNVDHRSLKNLASRLAYTTSIHRVIFSCAYSQFGKKLDTFHWNGIYRDNFSIRVNKYITKNQEKNIARKYGIVLSGGVLAKPVWRAVKKPKVKLQGSSTAINFFLFENKVYCCLCKHVLKDAYGERKSHLRPRPTPISLHPRLARALVNLSGAKKGDLIVDPFCGSGGILIEAGLMGLKIKGYDLSQKMIWKSWVNLKHFKLANDDLAVKDFFSINRKYNYIVCDPPYGLNASIMQKIRVTKTNRKEMQHYLGKFYEKIVKQLENITLKKAIIMFPSYIDHKKLIKNSKFKLKNHFTNYVHGNLTRHILVLEK